MCFHVNFVSLHTLVIGTVFCLLFSIIMFRSVAKFLIFYLKEKFPEFDRHWTFIMMDVRAHQIQKYHQRWR